MNTQAQEHSRSTQVRGPREDVTPLFLPISLDIFLKHKYKRLLEMYVSTMEKSSRMNMKLRGEMSPNASSLTQEGVRPCV